MLRRWVLYVVLFVFVLSSFNTVLAVSGIYSTSFIFYIVSLLIAPVTMFVVGYFSITYRSVWKSILLAFLAFLALMGYRCILSPYYPTAGAQPSTENELMRCGANVDSIEVVYTWVNVTDTKWQNVSRSYGCEVESSLSGSGDADPFNALKFSMRSVAANFPYVSKFVIVTERDQAPTWLNRDDPMVQVVFHDEFMPPESAPVFNSNPTEYLLYRLKEKRFIKNDCFLYLNDDFLINKPLKMRDFITNDGRIVFYSVTHLALSNGASIDVPLGMWDIEEPESRAWIVDPHVPYLMHVAAGDRLIRDCGNECTEYLTSRCSRVGPMPIESYHKFLAHKHAYLLDFISPFSSYNMRVPLGLSGATVAATKLLLAFFQPKFVYIESHDSVEDIPEMRAFVIEYLSSSFPDKARWEI